MSQIQETTQKKQEERRKKGGSHGKLFEGIRYDKDKRKQCMTALDVVVVAESQR